MRAEPWRLRLTERALAAGTSRAGEVEVWALFRDGAARIGPAGEALEAKRGRGGVLLEIARGRPLAEPGTSGILTCTVAAPVAGPVLLRVDRIRLAPGSITPRHRHVGPGIRLLLEGALDAMVGDRRFPVRQGEAWLETPEEDVIGRACPTRGAVFVRFVLLPPDLEGGRTSFLAVAPLPGDPTGPFEREQTILAERVLAP